MTHTNVFITECMILYILCSVILATLILTGRSYICRSHTLQDAAWVWMQTAGAIMCTPSLCRNETITDIKNTLFYKDPTYVAVAATAKHLSNNNKEYADVLSIDWGRKASDLRDDDAVRITKVLRCLLTTHVKNTPFLFLDKDTVQVWRPTRLRFDQEPAEVLCTTARAAPSLPNLIHSKSDKAKIRLSGIYKVLSNQNLPRFVLPQTRGLLP